MFKNIIIKSVVESLIGWVLLAVVMTLTRDILHPHDGCRIRRLLHRLSEKSKKAEPG